MSILRSSNRRSTTLLVVGLTGVIASVVASPSFVAQHISPDKTLGVVTQAKVFALQVLGVVVGLAVVVQAGMHALRKTAAGISLRKAALAGLIVALVFASAPFLAYDVLRVRLALPIDRNEGWNAFHTTRLIQGGPLYPSLTDFPITPVNYPPLSFVLIGGLSQVTGNVVLTGRMVALAALVALGCLLYVTIRSLTGRHLPAVLGTLVWTTIMVQRAGHYVGMYDPQLLATALSFGALYFYARWADRLTQARCVVMAGLISLGLFVKHLGVVVPATLLITLLIEHRRHLRGFAVATALFSLVLLGGSWAYAGHSLVANLLVEADRPRAIMRALEAVRGLFLGEGHAVLLLPALALARRISEGGPPRMLLVYFGVSLAVGAFAVQGAGVDVNAWFDFWLAAALLVGMLAARADRPAALWQALFFAVFLLVPLTASWRFDRNVESLLNYRNLHAREIAFQRDVDYLRSVPGPVLFQEPLLGLLAGKRFLFDTTAGSWLITSGRVPPQILVEPIRRRRFDLIVLNADLSTQRRASEWMRAVQDAYRLQRPGYESRYFFYVPKPGD